MSTTGRIDGEDPGPRSKFQAPSSKIQLNLTIAFARSRNNLELDLLELESWNLELRSRPISLNLGIAWDRDAMLSPWRGTLSRTVASGDRTSQLQELEAIRRETTKHEKGESQLLCDGLEDSRTREKRSQSIRSAEFAGTGAPAQKAAFELQVRSRKSFSYRR
jgi:hypothetical protein